MDTINKPIYLTVRETAARLGVHENTVRNWARDGRLKSARIPGARSHRFDERDVERLRKNPGAPVVSAAPEFRAVGPEYVGATQLEQWADTNDARGRLPELVRRLLISTKGITATSMRAGEGVDLAGWDGTAISSGCPFLPDGELRFEISAGHPPKKKADENYNKRKQNPLGLIPSRTVFTFVTPRRWEQKDAWAVARRQEGFWANVHVLDADDLEAWLHAAPAVHTWISECLGRQPRATETLDAWWSGLQSSVNPELPVTFFAAGREVEQTALDAALRNPTPQLVVVKAAWQSDGLAFLQATIKRPDSSEASRSPLIVKSPEVWEAIAQAPGRMTLVPLFDNANARLATSAGHHVVVIADAKRSTAGGAISLPPVDRDQAFRILQSAGVEFTRASELAALARRSMPSLIRALARDTTFANPPWALEPTSADLLAPLCLAGSWTTSPSDIELVSQLAAHDWPHIERLLTRWSTSDDPPFVQPSGSGPQWHLASPEEAFLIFRDRITRTDLERWRALAVDVLLELDPRLDLPPEQKPMASVLGATRKYSSTLRNGIAEGIALVGASAEHRLRDGRTGSEIAAVVVREVLRRAEADSSGRTWASLTDVLPLLAEAAPAAFLDQVHHDLGLASPILPTLFQDRTSGLWFYESSPHTGLLWALETLAWSPDWTIETCRALARLHQLDPGGKLSNRPLESLANILVQWVRQTSADVTVRKATLEAISGAFPAVAWQLIFKIWPGVQGTAMPPHAPHFRDWKPDDQEVPLPERLELISHLVQLAIDLAPGEHDRWADLMEHIGHLPPNERRMVLDFLERSIVPESLDPTTRLELWERLHAHIREHRTFANAAWSIKGDTLARLEAVEARLEPNSPERNGWLFDWVPRLPEVGIKDHDAYEKRLHELRLQSVHEVLEAGGDAALARLADRSPVPAKLGWVVGEVASEELTPGLLRWLDDENDKLRQLADSWAQRKLRDEGVTWLRSVLARPDMKPASRLLAVALAVPQRREFWGCIDQLEPDIVSGYWRTMTPWNIEPGDVAYVVDRLLAHQRGWTAVEVVAHQIRDQGKSNPLPLDLILSVLDAALDAAPASAPSQMLGYELGQILDFLERAGFDQAKLAIYEFRFFRLLEHHRPPRAFFAALSAEPDLFVTLVRHVYRGKSAPRRPASPAEEALATHAWSILQEWRSVPGTQPDGTIDEQYLMNWVRRARLALSEHDRVEVGDEEIGRVLAASPLGSDGAWPSEAVRAVIEAIGSTALETGVHVGRCNDRGVTWRGPFDGGSQERDLVSQFQRWAVQIDRAWPRTSRVLRRLAEGYAAEARQHDDDAAIAADTR